jgi:predicted ArsR family transcriptional regulator
LSGGGDTQWDGFAVEDALALRAEIAVVRECLVLDPRFRPLLDRARMALLDAEDERGLDAALHEFAPIIDALSRWPDPLDAPPIPREFALADHPLAWPDRRMRRCAPAFSALWALAYGPDDERGRLFAHAATHIARRGCSNATAPSPGPAARTRSDIDRRPPLGRTRPRPSDPDVAPPDILDALAPHRPGNLGPLSRPSARRIASVLHASPEGATVREIADSLGLHHTTVRAQLAALEFRGVVEAHADPAAGPGRPPVRYAVKPNRSEREAAGHEALVRLAMSLARSVGFGPAEVELFGAGQGAAIVRPGGGLAEVTAAFDRLGFAPRCSGGTGHAEVVLGRCPFAAADGAPPEQLICRLHRGIVKGMAQVAAPGVELVDMREKDVEGAGCRLRLSPSATGKNGRL